MYVFMLRQEIMAGYGAWMGPKALEEEKGTKFTEWMDDGWMNEWGV